MHLKCPEPEDDNVKSVAMLMLLLRVTAVRHLLIRWLSTSLESFLGSVISASSSFIGRFMKAALVGANTVQGPAAAQHWLVGAGDNSEDLLL